MSLPIFHFVFISLSTLLSLAFAYGSIQNYFLTSGQASDLALGALALVGGLALFIYGNRFFRKIKTIGKMNKPLLGLCIAITVLGSEISTFACSTCMRGATGPTASALNGAIITMLLIIGPLLAGFAIFFLVLRRRSRLIHDISPLK